VLTDTELWDKASNATTQPSIPYPWKGVQEKLRGMRGGELVLFTAGSGIGKTTVVRELAAHLIEQGEKVGWIALEESARDSVLGFLSIAQSHPLHLDPAVDWDVLKPVWEERYAGKVTCYDHFGSLAGDRLLSRIRYMVVGLGCKWVVLDHVSIVVSGLEIGDERKAIDVLMTRLRSLVEETGCGLLLVSHLKRRGQQEGAYESGSMPKLSDLRGSASLEQLSNAVVALGRAQDEGATVAEIAVLKNRFASVTGPAGTLEYDLKTGRYNEITAFEALENSL
jgi:twinkle protein